MATVATIQEAVWLRNPSTDLFGEFGTMKIKIDNKGAISSLRNNNYSSRTKHMDIKAKLIKEKIDDEIIELKKFHRMLTPKKAFAK